MTRSTRARDRSDLSSIRSRDGSHQPEGGADHEGCRGALTVGVFVDAPLETVNATAESPDEGVQLHRAEDDAYVGAVESTS